MVLRGGLGGEVINVYFFHDRVWFGKLKTQQREGGKKERKEREKKKVMNPQHRPKPKKGELAYRLLSSLKIHAKRGKRGL